ncbi:MAG: hypothetical protein DME18_03640 [Verrucomicrobia bacterium]|nr:MAG: hypothetical protein DME18_03640 [Verrucomicrobiota bacterium]
MRRFMVPMHDSEIAEAFFEPRSSRREEAPINFGFRLSDFGFWKTSLLTSAATVQGHNARSLVSGKSLKATCQNQEPLSCCTKILHKNSDTHLGF